MARISIDEIKDSLSANGWILVSEKYVNLDQNLEYICNEGHTVIAPWKKIRNKCVCPICETYKKNKITVKTESKKPEEYRILALDQATHNTGYAVFVNRKLVDSGVFVTKTDKSEIARCAQVADWLLAMVEAYEIDMVGLEQIQLNIPKSPITFEALAHLQGILMFTCHKNNIIYRAVNVGTWRSHCGVKGNQREVQKKNMQKIAERWYGFYPTDDEADAIGIGRYLSDMMAPKVEVVDWENG